ncbi:hypothetical protein Ana3638_10375 [Anaerocolumna sedimenticola]|uniref:Rubrerythrin diiron-binding domain-containing protein n=1 Tax=Anaerocolumna sedimenticola TaxID=2696063 RepID=A0A6P1TL18_9FIRM|nr:hypothetical protein [Anaerocolumna sedimenticola]QHQ61123.1 hypothetical protein Ana3638_10375 [Anaerocolumna sedimenticola]
MKNTITDLLHKLLDLGYYLEKFYRHFRDNQDFALKNTAAILASEERKHIEIYRNIVKEVETKEEYPIEDELMGYVNYLLINMKQSLNNYGIITPGQLIAKAIDNENKQIFLLSQIIEMSSTAALPPYFHEILTFLLKEENNQLANLLPFNKLV